MRTFDVFPLFKLAEFEATELASRTLEVFLIGRGLQTIQIVRGNQTSIVVDGVLLPVLFDDKNPFIRENLAVFYDEDDTVSVGYEVL